MKKALLLSFALMLVASMAFGQTGLGSVGMFADPAGASCNLLDMAPMGVKTYFVVHVLTTGATGSQYRAVVPQCMKATGAMYLSDTNMFGVTIGNSQTGVAVAYPSCLVGPIHTQTISVFAMGTTPACCRWYVDGDPNTGSSVPLIADCAYLVWPGPMGGQGIINSNPTCNCDVPNEDTTWGQVKALYE
jgi:hypothetical protein